jgi:hypothetical protein
MTAPIGRRALLRLLVTVTGLLATPGRPSGSQGPRYRLPQLHPLARFFTDLPGVQLVGAAYLAAHPDEADAARLAAHIDLPAGTSGLTPPTIAAWGTAFRRRQGDDFRAGRLVLLHGWFFALGEARLCALLQLETATVRPAS